MCELASNLVLRGTFIDEETPQAPSLRRSGSDPCVAGCRSGSELEVREHNYAVRLQERYTALLAAKARQLGAPQEAPKRRVPARIPTNSSATTAGSRTALGTPYPTEDSLPAACDSLSSDSLPAPCDVQDSCPATCDSLPSAAQGDECGCEASGAHPSEGSIGHPGLCNRPCILFARGACGRGRECDFCHQAHTRRSPHLDKRHREHLLSLPFGQRVAVAMPSLRRQVHKLGLSAEAQPLLSALEDAARKEATCKGALGTKRQGTSLFSALGVLSFRSLIMAVCKSSDAPDWLGPEALDRQLEQIRATVGARDRR